MCDVIDRLKERIGGSYAQPVGIWIWCGDITVPMVSRILSMIIFSANLLK